MVQSIYIVCTTSQKFHVQILGFETSIYLKGNVD